MKSFPKSLSNKLSARTAANALRQMGSNGTLVDFSSNDYLGLSASKEIFESAHEYLVQNSMIVNGSTGSRLLSGNHSVYGVAEKFIANFHNAESALIFNSGYDANAGFFSSIPQKGDMVLYDEYSHASIRDGLRLSNAVAYKFSHNNYDVLTGLIERYRDSAAEIYVVTESVFSMDGDTPNLSRIADICTNFKCRLVVDEAHAIGVYGARGEGIIQALNLQEQTFARIVTFGKGAGCHGAAVLGSLDLASYLINFARSFIYTTALPPHSVATILMAYRYMATAKERADLHCNISFFTKEIVRLGIQGFIVSTSAIHCIIIPGNNNVKNIAAHLQQCGFNVKAILSPTVPEGSERLRFCLHAYNTKEQIMQVLELLTAYRYHYS